MDNAERLFELIKDVEYIKNNILHKEIEDTWLDCKQKSKSHHGSLDENDKSNFAKALSGFANTSGGILIFGLDARRDKEGKDLIKDIKPIKGMKLFESQLRQCEATIVQRSISGLKYKAFYISEDEGILIIYIPAGTNPPYRSMIDKEFYIRAGGSFHPVDLSVIESLVFKQIKPELEIDVFVKIPNTEQKELRKYFQIYFTVTNTGKRTAKNVFVQFRLPHQCQYSITNAPDSRFRAGIDDTGDKMHDWFYDKVIHPSLCITSKGSAYMMEVTQDPNAEYPPILTFNVTLCANDMPAKTKAVTFSGRQMFLMLIKQGQTFNLLKDKIS